jgi:hypothetical protein
MTLNAPRVLFFVLSLIIAILAVINSFVQIVAVVPNTSFWLMTIAFVILALSCMIKGM